MYITRLGEAKRFWNTPKAECVYQNNIAKIGESPQLAKYLALKAFIEKQPGQ